MRRVALIALLLAIPAWADAPIRIAVAANFRTTLEKINVQFEARTGYQVVLSSASTGVLYSQIINGAPFQLFFAADRASPERLVAARPSAASSDAFCYALGRLVLTGGDGTLDQLADPARSLAIANPVTAPYGKAAMQVLDRPRFRPGRGRKLVRGNNVAQAYQFWHSGAVGLALVPRALIPTAPLPRAATPVPGDWHSPLAQYAVVLTRNRVVDAYLKWIKSATVRALIIDAGYDPCP